MVWMTEKLCQGCDWSLCRVVHCGRLSRRAVEVPMGLKVLWLSPVLRCGVLGRKATAVGSKAVWLPGLTWLAL